MKRIAMLALSLALALCALGLMALLAGATPGADGSVPIQVTGPGQYSGRDPHFASAYDRGPSIANDGTYAWLFWTRGDDTSTGGVRGPGYNPDADTYAVYYRVTLLVDVEPGDEQKLELSASARPAGFSQRAVSATYFKGDLYAFVSSGQDGTDRGLYYYKWDGASWSGPTTLIADATARGGHVNVTSDADYVYIVWEATADGSSDAYTWDGTTLSARIDISTGNQPKISLMDGTLYVVSIEDGTGDIEVYSAAAGADPTFGHHSTAIPVAGGSDPCIFHDGANLYVVTSLYDALNDRRWLVGAYDTGAAGSWSAARRVSPGGYGGAYWWDRAPAGLYTGTDLYLFFTTETNFDLSGEEPSLTYSDGEIFGLQMGWDMDRDHYLYLGNAVEASTEGDTIQVAEGEHLGQLSITEGITLTGGWDPTFTTRTPGASTVDGQGLGRVISIICASADTVVVVDGFTVQNGNATGLGGAPASASATEDLSLRRAAPDPAEPLDLADRMARLRTSLAGVVDRGLYPGGATAYQAMLARVEEQIARLESSQAQPESTRNAPQQAADCGGGIYSWNTSLHLLNSTIQYNIASVAGDGRGGGVCVGQTPPSGALIAGNTFRDNIASAAAVAEGDGGGLYALQAPGVVIEDNNFTLNTAMDAGFLSHGLGGGLMVWDSPDAVVRGNELVRNTANAGTEAYQGLGGGAYLGSSDGATVEDNELRENLAMVHGTCAGGGLMVNGSEDVVVAGNQVAGNWACLFQTEQGAGGGGISLYDTNGISVTGNTVQDNTAAVSGIDIGVTVGGGIDGENWLWGGGRIAGNTFSGNVASLTGTGWGGGLSLWASSGAEVADNLFEGNVGSLSVGEGSGGGLFLFNSLQGAVLRNRFQGNLAAGEDWGEGGGFAAWEEGPLNFNLTVDANTFLDNQASADPTAESVGGACAIYMDGLTFSNNVIAGNEGDAGVTLRGVNRTTMTNNTLVDNSDAGVLASWSITTPITFTNNIVVSHSVGISVTEKATVTVRYTLWDGNDVDIGGAGTISHTHPVSGTPGFVDPAADDYHLTFGSAAINVGDPEGVPPAPDHDADGVARPQGLDVDLGAYEWQGHWRYLPFVARNWQLATGWATGEAVDGYGTIIHTTNSGATWVRQGTAGEIPDVDLSGVAAIDAQNAWVVGGLGIILRTHDGGRTWQRQEVPAEVSDAALYWVYAVDGNTAWVVGSSGVILHTTDGGQTWTRQGQDTAPAVDLNGVYASDAEHAWVAGEGEDVDFGNPRYNGTILRTSDGGVTWERMLYELSERNEFADGLLSIHGADANTVWAVGHGQTVHTADGGLTWVQQTTGGGMIDHNGVAAVDRNTVWVTTDYGGIFRSDDGGATWEDQKHNMPEHLWVDWILRISAIDGQTAWATTEAQLWPDTGHVLHTADGGQTWIIQTTPVTPGWFWGVSFVK